MALLGLAMSGLWRLHSEATLMGGDALIRERVQHLAADFAEMYWYSGAALAPARSRGLSTTTHCHVNSGSTLEQSRCSAGDLAQDDYRYWYQRLEQQIGLHAGASRDLLVRVVTHNSGSEAAPHHARGELSIEWEDTRSGDRRTVRWQLGR